LIGDGRKRRLVIWDPDMPHPYRDLRDFLQRLEELGQLHRVSAQVDPHLEITEITDRVVKSSGPALVFENVRNSRMPVAINLFGSDRRMKLALGVEDYVHITDRITELLQPEIPAGVLAKLKKVPQLIQLAGLAPKRLRAGPCQEVVRTDDARLSELPILQCWPGDAGPYITMGLVITRDPTNRRQNVGIYRLQVFDDRRTGMHIHPFHDGARILREYARRNQPMPVAVAIGTDPALVYAASSPLPAGFDEMMFAAFLRGEPVEVVPARTVDLDVPAAAEIVLEGLVHPDRLAREGPFGDHTGFYSEAGDFPVFEISAITTRRDPIYHSIVVGCPPMEDTYLGWATERIFLPLVRSLHPEIVDYHMPAFGVFHNFLVVAIDKTYPHQARKVICGLWGLGQMMLSKFIVVVDADVNVRDLDAVMFEVAANVDPRRDTVIVDGPLDILDHAAPVCGSGSKMGIDATRKLPQEGHPRDWPGRIEMSPEIRQRVADRWADFGLPEP